MQNFSPVGAWRIRKGLQYETLARRFLIKQGLRWVESNYRCRLGEIDLIMQDRNMLVFVEVRYRAGNRFGSASETVDRRKQLKLQRTAQHYLLHHPESDTPACRFDVLGICSDPQQTHFDWLKNAFSLTFPY